MIHYKEITYGFEYGALTVERCISDKKKGWVILILKTKKRRLQLYVTKTGKIRIFEDGQNGKELK